MSCLYLDSRQEDTKKMHDGNPQRVLWSKIQLNTDYLEWTYTFTQMSIYHFKAIQCIFSKCLARIPLNGLNSKMLHSHRS